MRYQLMAAAALMATGIGAVAQVNYSSNVSGDVRVYRFTPNPRDAEFLRMFGNGTQSVDPNGWDVNQSTWSYGYVQWNLSGFDPNTQYEVTSARLTVTHQQNPNWNPAVHTQPLELRALGSNWTEATWDYTNAANPSPGQLLANGDLSNYVATGADFKITFDLNTDLFEQYLNSSLAGGKISFALTSAMVPSEQTRTPFYSVYSKDFPGAGVAPVLEITAQPVPEPATVGTLVLGALALLKRRKRSL